MFVMAKLVIQNADRLRVALDGLDARIARSVRQALDSEGRKMLEQAFSGLEEQSLAYQLGKIRERRFGL